MKEWEKKCHIKRGNQTHTRKSTELSWLRISSRDPHKFIPQLQWPTQSHGNHQETHNKRTIVVGQVYYIHDLCSKIPTRADEYCCLHFRSERITLRHIPALQWPLPILRPVCIALKPMFFPLHRPAPCFPKAPFSLTIKRMVKAALILFVHAKFIPHLQCNMQRNIAINEQKHK